MESQYIYMYKISESQNQLYYTAHLREVKEKLTPDVHFSRRKLAVLVRLVTDYRAIFAIEGACER